MTKPWVQALSPVITGLTVVAELWKLHFYSLLFPWSYWQFWRNTDYIKKGCNYLTYAF
jgi:hypothetical protein